MAEGGAPQGEERLPTLQDFLNNVELRSLYQDAEVQTIFKQIEDNPVTVLQHHNNPKVQQVLKLIQAEFDRHPPTAANPNRDFESTQAQPDGEDDMEEMLKMLQEQEKSTASY